MSADSAPWRDDEAMAGQAVWPRWPSATA